MPVKTDNCPKLKPFCWRKMRRCGTPCDLLAFSFEIRSFIFLSFEVWSFLFPAPLPGTSTWRMSKSMHPRTHPLDRLVSLPLYIQEQGTNRSWTLLLVRLRILQFQRIAYQMTYQVVQ